ncbi:MAG: C69 family dipeptidase, partial [Bacteroidaceae bacterium]|nr:C69 family dipeptidase [Bacteroidaceae bacterium]
MISERMVTIMKFFKTMLSLALATMLCLTSVSAFACTAIYVGADLTVDGSTMFARSEDISNSYNKVFYVAEAGNHKAGEVYQGCYGFTYTFTKDSYAYTAFSDDNLSGYCPDCGGEHAHTPYEAGGTNEMGLTVTATETLSGA